MLEFIKKLLSLKVRKRILFTLAFGAIALGFLIFSPYGIIKSIKLAGQRADSYEEVKEMKKINDSLRKEIKEIKTDTNEIERIAREKYGMVRKGEKVYIRKKPKTNEE